MRVGIFFGGRSREREISFAGGRTIYDNLDKSVFTPVPIFVDGLGNFVLLHWQNIYKGAIPDFYPSKSLGRESNFKMQIDSFSYLGAEEIEGHVESIGQVLYPHEFSSEFDFAFLALHGAYGEDGAVQGLLEWYNIPYSGTSTLGSAVGMDKSFHMELIKACGYNVIEGETICIAEWMKLRQEGASFSFLKKKIGSEKLVIKSCNQGSSIGVSVSRADDRDALKAAIDKAFFMQELTYDAWQKISQSSVDIWLSKLIDYAGGIGFPLLVDGALIYKPHDLRTLLEEHFSARNTNILLKGVHSEAKALIEPFVDGREFSCIVLKESGSNPVALPPTEMIKSKSVFSYRDKYLPGAVNKLTPIPLSLEEMKLLTDLCCEVFSKLRFQVYGRIDGIIADGFRVFINDPNTMVGMTPSSFLFHQTAEIGLSASQLITFIIYNSLLERATENKIFPKCQTLADYVKGHL